MVGARPAMGKCVAWDTPIVDPRHRRRAHRRRAPPSRRCSARTCGCFALGDDGRLAITAPSAYVDDGRKPVFRVRTRLGPRGAHHGQPPVPHRRRAGSPWPRSREGDTVAVPAELPVFGSDALPGAEVGLLGYLVGIGAAAATTAPVLRCIGRGGGPRPAASSARAPRSRCDRFVEPGDARRFDVDPVPGPRPPACTEHRDRSPTRRCAACPRPCTACPATSWPPSSTGCSPSALPPGSRAGAAGRGRVPSAPRADASSATCSTCSCGSGSTPPCRAPIVAANDAAWVTHELEISGADDLVAAGRRDRDRSASRRRSRSWWPTPGRRREAGARSAAPRPSAGRAAQRRGRERPTCAGTRSWPSTTTATSRSTTSRSPSCTTSWPATCSCTTRPSRSGWWPTPRSSAQRPVLFFSLEMSNLELSQRLLCAEARVDSHAGAQRPAPGRTTGRRSRGRWAASPTRRSGSTTTRTSRSWRSGPRPAGSRARSATSA